MLKWERERNRKVNKMIIEEFYNQYYRSPQYNEFRACGGKLVRGLYHKLIKEMGYPAIVRGKAKTYEVVKDNEVVFIGTSPDLAYELNYTKEYIVKLCNI